MLVYFRTTKMNKIFEKEQKLKQEYGDKCARKIMRRLSVLKFANNLDCVPKVKPDRCHELHNNRKGTFAVDLQHPFRLIFKPDMDNVPLLDDGGIDLKKVTSIKILQVEDYH